MNDAAHIAALRGRPNNPAFRPEGADLIGAAGELAFAKRYGLEVGGLGEVDAGFDFVVDMGGAPVRVDVKCSRHADCLIAWPAAVNRKRTDIYVLSHWLGDDCAQLVGWCNHCELAQAPLRDFGHGPTLALACEHLRPMASLDYLVSLHHG